MKLRLPLLALPLVICSSACETGGHTGADSSGIAEYQFSRYKQCLPASQLAQDLTVSDEGIGGIDNSTYFNHQALRAALPGLEIHEGTQTTEAEQYFAFKVLSDNVHVLTILPGSQTQLVGSVWVLSNCIANSLGHSIGARFQEVYQVKSPNDCQPGVEELSGTVICTAPAATNVKYLFEGEWDGPDGELPPIHSLNLWTISRIIWTAPEYLK